MCRRTAVEAEPFFWLLEVTTYNVRKSAYGQYSSVHDSLPIRRLQQRDAGGCQYVGWLRQDNQQHLHQRYDQLVLRAFDGGHGDCSSTAAARAILCVALGRRSYHRYPFQQGAESLGFSGSPKDIIGGYGNALLNFLGIAGLFVQPELAPIAADAIVLGRFPAYVDLADQLGAKAFNLGTFGWAALGTDTARWGANQAFIDAAIANGDRVLFASDPFSAANALSFFEREVNYLQSRGFAITPKEAFYPPK